MAVKYYFAPNAFEIFPPGSIFKKEVEELINIDTNIEPNDNNIQIEWVEISPMEMKWLLKRGFSERIKCQELRSFKNICDLDKDSNCFYRNTDDYIQAKIMRKINNDQIIFSIKLENGKTIDAPSEDIDLYNDDNQNTQTIEEILKLLVDKKGNIQQDDTKKRCVLSMAYALPNKSYFKMFLDTYECPLDINLDHIKSLLRKIISCKDWYVLDLVLQKCDISPINNTFLVQLCIEALKKGDNGLLGVVLKFSPNMDPLVNGETFITNLFKENIDGPTIQRVVEMNLFNVNLANGKDETPLMLACSKLFVKVVEALLKNGADAKYKAFSATNRAVMAGIAMPDKKHEIDEILTLLHNTYEKMVDLNQQGNTIEPTEDAVLDELELKLLEIMKLLVVNKGDIIIFNDTNVSVLSLLHGLPNNRLFHIFVKKHGQIDLIESAHGRDLITKIVSDRNMDNLKVLFGNYVYKDDYDEFLLNLALTTVNYGINNLYKMIAEKCKHRDMIILDGETFLTSCFKGNVKTKIISDIIDSGYFDINEPNLSDETALILACQRQMVDCVKRLLNKGADKSYGNYGAVKILQENEEKIDPINAILDLMCGKNAEIKEKLQITNTGFIDTTKLSTVTKLPCDLQIGDPVTTVANNNIFNGEVKCICTINDQICVGIALDKRLPDGFDGIINGNPIFQCSPGHGVLATIDQVKLDAKNLQCKLLPSRIFDPKCYLRFKDIKDRGLLKMMGLKINDRVYANINKDGEDTKLIGFLRRFGVINDRDYAAIIELDENYAGGTNGLFWKHQLIECEDNRAIAMKIDNISKYFPFQMARIPDTIKRFPIDYNSKVKCYFTVNDEVCDLYGTIVWTGLKKPMDKYEESKYVYGIELNDDFHLGTDGEFESQRLFQCDQRRGLLSPIDSTIPDENAQDIPIDDYPLSEDVDQYRFSIPNNKYRENECGIAGHEGSSFLDSLIFAFYSKSDVLDWLICPLVNESEINQFSKQVREIMIWKIVCPLRVNSFVSYHKMKELRDIIRAYNSKWDVISDPDTDLENFSPVLRELCGNEPLLSVTTSGGNKCNLMYIRTSPKFAKFATSKQLLDMYMLEKQALFQKVPSCLILKVPMEPSTTDLKRLLPLNDIDISHLCVNHFRRCSHDGCHSAAMYRCENCANKNVANKNGLLCTTHMCNHVPDKITSSIQDSQSKVELFLKSIICVSNEQCVAYVKDNETDNTWIYFDNGISKQRIIPEVTPANDVGIFLQKDINNMKMEFKNPVSVDVDRITKDSYILVYLNSTMSCY